MPTQTINLNSATPAIAAPGQNVIWQADPPSLDPAVVRNVTANMPRATTALNGAVRPDGAIIVIDGTGLITVPKATGGSLGVVQPDGVTITVDGTGKISTSGSVVYRGAWSSSTSYSIGNIVTFGALAYLRLTTASANPPALIQSQKGTASGGAVLLTMASAVTAGNLLVVSVSSTGTFTGTPTDTLGTTYVLKKQVSGALVNLQVWAGIAPSSGMNTVTTGQAGYPNAAVFAEFSNATATVDASASGVNGSSPSLLNVTLTDAGDLVYVASGAYGNPTFTAGTGFTLIAGAPADSCAAEWGIISSPGAYSVGFTATGSGQTTNMPVVAVAFATGTLDPATDTTNWIALGEPNSFLNPMTTAGDLIVGGSAGAPTRLAAATSGYVLTSGGAGVAPSWQSPSGGGSSGSLAFLEGHTAAAVASLVFNSWYSVSYDEYVIEFIGLVPSSTAGSWTIQVSPNGGTSYDTTSGNYDCSQRVWSRQGEIVGGPGPGTSLLFFPYVSRSASNASGQSMSGSMRFYGPASANYKQFIGKLLGPDSANTSTVPQGVYVMGYYCAAATFNAFKVSITSGTFNGTIRVYGVSH